MQRAPSQPGAITSGPELPPMSDRLRKKIVSGEFVPLEEILNDLKTSALPSKSHIHLVIQDGGVTPMPSTESLAGPRSNKRHIDSFETWLEAWNVFLSIYVHAHPARALELITYQRHVSDMARSFTLKAWLEYDVAFRMRMAQYPSRRWDTVDLELWTSKLLSSSAPKPHMPIPPTSVTPTGLPKQGRIPCSNNTISPGTALMGNIAQHH